MITIRWGDSNTTHEAVCGNSEDAWVIYWALKKSLSNQKAPVGRYYIEMYNNGVALNPEKGFRLPPLSKE